MEQAHRVKCVAVQTVDDFEIGDLVMHPDGAFGRVVHFGPEGNCRDTCVHVAWEADKSNKLSRRKWRGAYPNAWLRQHSLTPIKPKT